MAKKPEEKTEIETPTKVEEKNVEKVEAKVEAVEKKVEAVTGERKNIVNYVPEARTSDADFDFKSWAKSVDEKIEKLLGSHKESKVEEPKKEEPKPEPKKAWYNRELF